MLPSKTDKKWESLVTGELQATFNLVAGNMLMYRLTRSTKQDNSAENIQNSIDEAYKYFSKFESLFSEELKRIFN